MSGLVRRLFEQHFFPTAGHHMRHAGVRLQIGPDGPSHFVFLELGMLVADELALKDMVNMIGASGLKPCPQCENVVAKNHELHHPDLVCMTSLELHKMRPHTDESIMNIIHRLRDANGTMSAARYEDLEKTLGFRFNLNGLLMSESITPRVISWMTSDWMHVYLVHGIFNVEFGQFLRRVVVSENILQTALAL